MVLCACTKVANGKSTGSRVDRHSQLSTYHFTSPSSWKRVDYAGRRASASEEVYSDMALFSTHTRQPLLGYSSLDACEPLSDGSSGFPFQLTSVSVSSPTLRRPWPPYPGRMGSKARRPPGNVRQVLQTILQAALRRLLDPSATRHAYKLAQNLEGRRRRPEV